MSQHHNNVAQNSIHVLSLAVHPTINWQLTTGMIWQQW